MKVSKNITEQEFKKLLISLVSEPLQNDGTLSAHTSANIDWAWENWEDEVLRTFYEAGEKPENPTDEFIKDWIENEPFEMELEQIRTGTRTEI